MVPEGLKELEKAVDAEAPPQGTHTCAHQEKGIFPCAYPSCPDSPAGNFLRLRVRRPNGKTFKAQFKRKREIAPGGEVRFTWRPA